MLFRCLGHVASGAMHAELVLYHFPHPDMPCLRGSGGSVQFRSFEFLNRTFLFGRPQEDLFLKSFFDSTLPLAQGPLVSAVSLREKA